MSFFSRIKNAVRTGTRHTREPTAFTAAGKKVLCAHCGYDQFIKREVLLNTAGLTLLGLDWANRSANTLHCANCGLVQWFARPPLPLEALEALEGEGPGD